MNHDAFEKRMRELECFHMLKALPGAWLVVRVDGHSFSRFTSLHYKKPFDTTLHGLMVETATKVMTQLHGSYAYTESDEISVLFKPDWDYFDREVEKIVSISASIAAAVFTHASGKLAHFDSRVWLGATKQQVIDYFRWRQADAERCGLNTWCYWTLRNDGMSVAQATATLARKTVSDKNELLFQHGINYNDLPVWQRRGTGIVWETYEKAGFNPKSQTAVTALRRRTRVDEALPMKDAYSAYIGAILDTASSEDVARP